MLENTDMKGMNMKPNVFSKKHVSHQIVKLSDIDEQVISEVDLIIHRAFQHPKGRYSEPYSRNFTDAILCLLKYQNIPIGVAFGEPRSYPTDPIYFPSKQIMVHSIAIDPQYQGNKLCYGLVKCLVSGLRKIFGKTPIFMNVRVTEGSANGGAIRCYERNHFALVRGVPPVMKDDGPNAYMVLESHSKHVSHRRRKRKSKRKSKRMK